MDDFLSELDNELDGMTQPMKKEVNSNNSVVKTDNIKTSNVKTSKEVT